MRLSLNQQVQNALIYMNTASLRLSESQNRAASGKRILRPSDDVPGTDRALNLRSGISSLQQLADNTSVSKALLQVTENALGDVCGIVGAVRNIAVAAANGVLSPGARDSYVQQLEELMTELADLANTRYMGHYIFSGTATETPAVEPQVVGDPYVYTGDQGVHKAQILPGIAVPLNIPGDGIFNFGAAAGGGTTDLFTMIRQLQDAISSGNPLQVSQELTNIDANMDNVLSCRSRVGSWIQRIDRAQDLLEGTKLRIGELLSEQEDIDLAEAVVELKTRENVYQAALLVSSRILDLSLASLSFS